MAQTQNAGAAVAAGHVGGKVFAGIQLDFGADVSAKLAVGSTVDVVMKAIPKRRFNILGYRCSR